MSESDKQEEKPEPVVGITDEGSKWIKRFIEDQSLDPEVFAFRLGVHGGGCSGLEYVMRMDKVKDDDMIYEHNDARMVMDPKSARLLNGSKLHFVLKYQGAGFTVINPRIQSACGCGASFSLKPETPATGSATGK